MNNWLANDIISFFIAFMIVTIILPQVIIIAYKKKIFDNLEERKVHHDLVPRIGGISFFPTILFTFAIISGFTMKYGDSDTMMLNVLLMPFLFWICASFLLYFVGLRDDLLGIGYLFKFIYQIFAAILIIFSGLTLQSFFGFIWIEQVPNWIGWIVSGTLVIYIVNSINLIDGIDGLASGIGIITLIFYAIFFFLSEAFLYSILACAGAGTLLAFFYFNVFGSAEHSTKIFMGDTGALTIGITIAFCFLGLLHSGYAPIYEVYNPVIIAISPLLIPCFDVIRVYLRRVIRGKNPFLADKAHIHHKLLALGFRQNNVLLLILFWAMAYIVINMVLSPHLNPTFVLLIDAGIWILINMIITGIINRKETKTGVKTFDHIN